MTERPPEYDLAYAILAAAADPVKAKARLDELIAKEATLKELTDTLNEARAEHEKKAADLKRRHDAHEQADAALAAKIAKTDFTHRETADFLATRHRELEAGNQDVKKRQAALDAKEADYQRRVA